ncbi:MAG: hypothetical protein ACI89L_002156 [Phycisphaerales bacterium]|jgi:hypothetical protein
MSRSHSLVIGVVSSAVVALSVILQGCAAGRGRPGEYINRASLYNSLNRDHYLVIRGNSAEITINKPSADGLDIYSRGPKLQLLMEQYHLVNHTDAELERLRGQIVDLATTLINLQFQEFVADFSDQRKGFDTGADLGSIALDAAATLITNSGTQSILAAVSGGLTASKIAINKNYFYEQSLPVVIAKMHAERQQVSLDLVRGSRLSVGDYPLTAALSDIARFYNAGTFEGAITSIQRDSGSQLKETQTEIRQDVKKRFDALDERGRTAEELVASVGVDNARQSLREVVELFGEDTPEGRGVLDAVAVGCIKQLEVNQLSNDRSALSRFGKLNNAGLLRLSGFRDATDYDSIQKAVDEGETATTLAFRFDTLAWLDRPASDPLGPTPAQLVGLLRQTVTVDGSVDATRPFRDAAIAKLEALAN